MTKQTHTVFSDIETKTLQFGERIEYTKPKKLLGIDTNYKTAKGQAKGYMTGILYLSPADLSGYEVCPMRSPGCTAACLNTAGRGGMNSVQKSRLNKTRWYFNERDTFMAQLVKDIEALIRKAKREGYTPCVRLNGTSDIPWERVPVGEFANIMSMFPAVQFYDYTKITKRAIAHARGEMPANYHLTFSATESNKDDVLRVLAAGGNVAIVYFEQPLGKPGVVDADETDLRFLDQSDDAVEGRGLICALKAKGKARKDVSGFVW